MDEGRPLTDAEKVWQVFGAALPPGSLVVDRDTYRAYQEVALRARDLAKDPATPASHAWSELDRALGRLDTELEIGADS